MKPRLRSSQRAYRHAPPHFHPSLFSTCQNRYKDLTGRRRLCPSCRVGRWYRRPLHRTQLCVLRPVRSWRCCRFASSTGALSVAELMGLAVPPELAAAAVAATAALNEAALPAAAPSVVHSRAVAPCPPARRRREASASPTAHTTGLNASHPRLHSDIPQLCVCR
eukprot:6180231-Pleurochrysis_carterae.AAC.2